MTIKKGPMTTKRQEHRKHTELILNQFRIGIRTGNQTLEMYDKNFLTISFKRLGIRVMQLIQKKVVVFFKFDRY